MLLCRNADNEACLLKRYMQTSCRIKALEKILARRFLRAFESGFLARMNRLKGYEEVSMNKASDNKNLRVFCLERILL